MPSDHIVLAETQRPNAERPTPNTSIDYPAITKKFNRAWSEFWYRYAGNTQRVLFPSDFESEDEPPEIEHCEEIQNTPVQECITELRSHFHPDTSDSDLLASFTMLVEIATQIAGRIEIFVENVLGESKHADAHESKFFRGIYDALLDGAKLLSSKKIRPPRYLVYELADIGPGFEKIARELVGKRQKKSS